jgi:glucose/arabinose dehydrogenase
MLAAVRAATRLLALALAGFVALGLSPQDGQAATVPSGFQDSVVIGGLDEPTAFRFAPDGRVFVAEKTGKILVYENLNDEEPQTLADIRTEVYDTGDRGLLGMTLDPEFPVKPYVYALYTYDHILGDLEPAPKWGEADQSGDGCEKPEEADVDACPVSGRLVRFTVAENEISEELEVTEELPLVEDWCQQNSSHSIGTVEFGPEGALYAGGGDGASFTTADYGQFGWPQPNQCNDPPGEIGEPLEIPDSEGGSLRAQNPQNLDGSIIRVDPETGEGLAGNPMLASADENEKRIVAMGLRNPFRFTVQPGTGELYVGNVGANSYEEIDRFDPLSSPVFNSGWPCYEGPDIPYEFRNLELDVCKRLWDEEPEVVTPPLFDYAHQSGVTPEDTCPHQDGSAVSGMTFYDGGSFPPEYDGALFFSDSVRGCIYVMRAGEDGKPIPATTEDFVTDARPYPGIDIQVGPGGDLYYTSLFGPGFGPGSLHRISYVPGAPTAVLTADPEWGKLVEGSLEVHLDASGSSDPESEGLSFEWDFENDGEFVPGASEETLNLTEAVNRKVTVRVSDESEKHSVAQVILYPGDTPPTPVIEMPADEGLEWEVGQAIEMLGSAQDGEGNGLPYTMLYWHTRLYHCPNGPENCHAHPLQVFPGVEYGILHAPDHDYPSHLEISLTASDDRGLSKSTSVQLYPHEVDLPIDAAPSGVTLGAGLLNQPTPFTAEAILGSKVTLSAPQSTELAGVPYDWKSWSDGGARVHTIVAGSQEAGVPYVAEYEEGEIVEPGGEEPGGEEPPPEPPAPSLPSLDVGLSLRVVLRAHPHRRTRKANARFVFSANGPIAGFRCKLDGTRYRRCRSPRVYRRLRPGRHVFRVLAIGKDGSRSAPRAFRWRVLRSARRSG